MQNLELNTVRTQLYTYSAESDYYFPSRPWERGLKKMDKQSDQRQPLRKKGVQSEGKEGEERGEKRRGKAGKGVG